MSLRFSVIVPSFQQGCYIREALDSVLTQECAGAIELIVVDGGSTDGTVDILKSYGDRIAWWVSEPDRGQSHALNKGFARATGNVLSWLCADDCYLPGAFARVEAFFEGKPDAEFLYGDGYSIDGDGQLLSHIISGPVLDRRNFINYNYVFSTSAFWKRSLWERSGGFIDEDNHWTMDWELFIRMNHCAELHYRPGFVACLRHHQGAKTSQGLGRYKRLRNREIARVSRRHGGWFCYNSQVHPLLELADLPRHFRWLPRPAFSLLFRACHLPLKFSGPGPRSIFFNGYRVPQDDRERSGSLNPTPA